MLTAIFKEVRTGDVGSDTRIVAGWSTPLEYVTTELTPEGYQAAFGAHHFLSGTYKYKKFAPVGQASEMLEVKAIICIEDQWPPCLLERDGQPGKSVLFDPTRGIGVAAPGAPLHMYINKGRKVRCSISYIGALPRLRRR